VCQASAAARPTAGQAGRLRALHKPWRAAVGLSDTAAPDFLIVGDAVKTPDKDCLRANRALGFVAMSLIYRLVSLLRSSEGLQTTVKNAGTVIRNVQTSFNALETAASQELASKAVQGDANAQFDCGEQYYFGHSVPQDHGEAAKWFRLAAEQGHAGAQASLGMLTALGRGVERDYVEAFKWVSLAAARGQESALKTQKSLLKKMTPEDVAEGQRRVSEFVAKKRT
jgi:hypothetical protein